MHRSSIVVSILFLLCLLPGCGDGNGLKANSATGRAVLTIQWPDRSRLLPAAANSIKVDIAKGATVVMSKLLARPATGNSTTATFDPLPIGDLTMNATAYPQADGTGTAQATGGTTLKIQASLSTPFTLTMSSTITQFDLTPANKTIKVSVIQQMTATAKDAGGAIVLLSATKLQWSSSNPGVASVDANGKVTGVSVGDTDISVTDSESGKSAKATLHVALLAPISFQSPSLISAAAPGALVTADFDGDGKLDIAVGTTPGLVVCYGHGDGTFDAPQTILTWTGGIAPYSAADMNGDGEPDLVCTVQGQFIVVHNLGGRHFAAPIAVPLNTEVGPLVTADFNGDGKPDVAIVAHDHPGSTSTDIFIFQNQGNGNYTQVSTVSNIWIILTIRAGDLNGDGKQDLLVDLITDIVGTSGASIYWGDGTGHFNGGPGVGTETGNTDWPVIADFNGDGKMDYAIANDWSGTLSVVLNAGGGTFTTPATYGCNSYPDVLEAADLDGDGAPDIIVENRGAAFFTVLRNQNALFPNAVTFPMGGSCGPLKIADVNGDGKPDVIISSSDTNNIAVLLNNTP